MATGTRSLPTDSPVPYFQPIERGHMSEGGLSDRNSQKAIYAGGVQISPQDGNNYPPVAAEPGIFTGLHDDYDTLEECEGIRRLYKPYLERYESKYRTLYQMLQQASKEQTSLLSTQELTSGITPSLAVLDDAPALK